jgi:hypothetical protein
MTVEQGRLILSSQLSLSDEITQEILTDNKIDEGSNENIPT